MKDNSGIGGWLYNNPKFLSDEFLPADSTLQVVKQYSYQRFFFDNLANILCLMILLQVFAGIIIDTFALLRTKAQEKLHDKMNYCFICGQKAKLFD